LRPEWRRGWESAAGPAHSKVISFEVCF